MRVPFAVASLTAEPRLECGLRSWGSRIPLFGGLWDLPRPGIKPMSPVSAGRFLSTGPAGKSCIVMVDDRHEVCTFQSNLLSKICQFTSLLTLWNTIFITPLSVLRIVN